MITLPTDLTKGVSLQLLIKGLNDIILKEATLMVHFGDAIEQLNMTMKEASDKQKKYSDNLYDPKPLKLLHGNNIFSKGVNYIANYVANFVEKPEYIQNLTMLLIGAGLFSTIFETESEALGFKLTGAFATKTQLYAPLLTALTSMVYQYREGSLTSASKKMETASNSFMQSSKTYLNEEDDLSKTISSATKAEKEMIENEYRSKIKK